MSEQTEVGELLARRVEAIRLLRTTLSVEHCLRRHGEGRLPALRGLLAIATNGMRTAGNLSLLLGLTSGATTRVIDQMVEAGWAKRVEDRDDRRRQLVVLTAVGRAKADSVLDALVAP